MQMLKKLFNSDKKYYLELPDEIEESKPVQAVVETAEKLGSAVKEQASAVKEQASKVLDSQPAQKAEEKAKKAGDVAQKQASKVVEQPAQKAEEVAKDKLPQDNKETQAKSKTDQKSDKSKQTQQQTKTSPQDAGASSFDPPFWVAAMYKNSDTSVNSDGTQAEQTFATDNLMPVVTKSRRRPGPSLNKFKDMANKAKTPKS